MKWAVFARSAAVSMRLSLNDGAWISGAPSAAAASITFLTPASAICRFGSDSGAVIGKKFVKFAATPVNATFQRAFSSR